ncbi:type II toxin-antitoxin system VapC family toxin [Devosia nitrariae]|uniref:Ribonuclease VapC n=1 Tax=Devosia nitrariae TaxID=2071872 RepID=A0ABQ5WF52_9HYPH|nr:type II toxin-antitoxin system VapC family toxin [Devosia nitrariae]GLQ58135.1 ribonuclease VapC [Devosia nitrariae]
MVRALFDTNILVDFLSAVPQAREELDRYNRKAISIITWMEVLVGARADVEAATHEFLSGFDIVPLDDSVAGRAVELRRDYRLKLPDAVIWASADVHSMLLVTRDSKDFPVDAPGIRVPYFL